MSDAYPRLCIVTAVDLEFQTIARLLRNRSGDPRMFEGARGGRRIRLIQSGMRAPGWADRAQPRLAAASWDGLLVAGFAGALDPALLAGDAVVYRRCLGLSTKIEPDRDEIASIYSDNSLSEFVSRACEAAGIRTVQGIGFTTDRILIEAQEKAALARTSGALAVDMETYAIWQAAVVAEIPVAALRIVSDDAQSDLPDFNQAHRPDGTMVASGMARVLLRRPAASVRFLLGLRAAVTSLRKAVKAVLEA